ncbi:sigma 54-interacting transcriptional regulator [Nitrococcus mobilis]|uniref:Two component transpcriptional regulator, fis family protein n=1 Tax=Nitrococcus mobilis Nb-231 TaxID=314278 RepID=A4BPD3_9GAMM|nr:sigma 54-interacting transcriptional regulator [Nitrococcus mobilis]EAR22434.1 Two component transpcriptional regulator, fis family protein [Nitrococcus mobilis Nb-231]
MAKGYRILVVDDDPGVLRLLSIRLKSNGYEVATAQSGEEALSNFAGIRPHLVITDLRMDGMDGMTLFQNLHKQHPTLPVIILTAHGSIPDAVEATQKGVFGFITKPFEAPALLQQVESALRLSGIVEPDTAGKQTNTWRAEIISRSPLMEDVLQRAKLIAPSEASVFIQGESGTGKELLAKAIHNTSRCSKGPFIAVNCGAIPEPLLESELFGHKKGAFTGANQDHEGLFKAADGGTLFLDEIGDMPLALQVKLLRVLQEHQVRPVGYTQDISVNVRIISATHRDLELEMAEGRFREDLYYRLNVVTLSLPSLAQRREDVPVLANHFLHQLARKYEKNLKGFSQEAMEHLVSAQWPGNIRQLYNVIEQVAILSATPIISYDLVQQALRGDAPGLPPFADARRDFERSYLVKLLQITEGNVSRAARLAKRNRTEFYKLLNRHDLNPSLFKQAR